ncbi:MAG: succinate dehydrogenase assembly factor 2 [Pelagibacteraceae bacterium]
MKKLEKLKKRIIYRSSYRGTKEMDILLSSFVEKYVNILNEKDLNELEELLNLEDEVIYNFFYKGITHSFFDKRKIGKLLKDFKL